MEWQGGRESENVEDRRGWGAVPCWPAAGWARLSLCCCYRPSSASIRCSCCNRCRKAAGRVEFKSVSRCKIPPGQEQLAKFVKVVLGETEDVWTAQFQRMGKEYRQPTLVLFTGSTSSKCGYSSAAVGPFYCPVDEKVYLDLSFFDELQQRFHAPGDFAQAYVIAHEVGHHVQKLLGISDQVDALRQRRRQGGIERAFGAAGIASRLFGRCLGALHATANAYSRSRRHRGSACAASAIGDDRLQKQAQGYVVPDSFTHGSSEQRVRWFKKGFETGDIKQGDTFSAENL